MTDDEFAIGVDAILLTGIRGHAAHRALDLWWTRYAVERGGSIEAATRKWMASIEGDHDSHRPYPLGGKRWWQFWRRGYAQKSTLTSDASEDEFGSWTCP